MSSSIVIISPPFKDSELVKEMNDVWVGVEISLSHDEGSYCLQSEAVFVDAWKAITCLSEKSPKEAVAWRNCTDFRGTQFIFRKENYEIITQLELAL